MARIATAAERQVHGPLAQPALHRTPEPLDEPIYGVVSRQIGEMPERIATGLIEAAARPGYRAVRRHAANRFERRVLAEKNPSRKNAATALASVVDGAPSVSSSTIEFETASDRSVRQENNGKHPYRSLRTMSRSPSQCHSSNIHSSHA
jgi:hypothetical protein